MNTLIVNLFAGPGAGKSTTAAGIFFLLKSHAEYSCELITEYAKDLTYEKRHGTLSIQPYVFGKQLWRLERVKDHVDIIITDSPILLSPIYNTSYPDSFNQSCLDIFRSFNNLNFLLLRTKEYSPVGRNQTEEEAIVIDNKIRQYLFEKGVSHRRIGGKSEDVVNEIYGEILSEIHYQKRKLSKE